MKTTTIAPRVQIVLLVSTLALCLSFALTLGDRYVTGRIIDNNQNVVVNTKICLAYHKSVCATTNRFGRFELKILKQTKEDIVFAIYRKNNAVRNYSSKYKTVSTFAFTTVYETGNITVSH